MLTPLIFVPDRQAIHAHVQLRLSRGWIILEEIEAYCCRLVLSRQLQAVQIEKKDEERAWEGGHIRYGS
jgi:hypothetical protein